jgi:hypothetical protein
MSFFVAKNPGDEALDKVTERLTADPQFSDRYEAIKELREMDSADHPSYGISSPNFKRVASLQGTLADLALVLNPDWLHEKKNFYGWLDKHPEHCTYDRRREKVSRSLTFSDGRIIQ